MWAAIDDVEVMLYKTRDGEIIKFFDYKLSKA